MTAITQTLWFQLRRLDRVVLSILLLFTLIAMVLPAQQLPNSLIFTLEALLEIAPYLLASAVISGYLTAAGADKMIGTVLQGRPLYAITAAALVGALSPFCSCGVIPLIAAALSAGVPLPAVMAFWLASPIMAPDMYVLTAATLGVPFATAKTAAAIGIGLLGGLVTQVIVQRGGFQDVLRMGASNGGCAGAAVRNRVKPHWTVWDDPQSRQKFLLDGRHSLLFLLKWLTVAFAIESLMVAYLPFELVATWLGTESLFAIPLAVAVGIPAYMNGYAAIPVVAGLVDNGMSQGAALAFMTAGGVTCIPAAMGVFALVKRPVFLCYLVLAVIGAMLSGLLWQLITG